MEIDQEKTYKKFYWNYRVIKTIDKLGLDSFQIYEVYYNKDGEIDGYVEPFASVGETKDELLNDMQLMMLAFDHPIIDQTNKK